MLIVPHRSTAEETRHFEALVIQLHPTTLRSRWVIFVLFFFFFLHGTFFIFIALALEFNPSSVVSWLVLLLEEI